MLETESEGEWQVELLERGEENEDWKEFERPDESEGEGEHLPEEFEMGIVGT